MDKLTFPIFPIADLVSFFKQNILTGTEAKNFSKNDIYPNPKPEVMQKLYMRVLQQVFNYGMEQFYMVPMDLDIPYPHLVEGFAPVANILKLMTRFMPMCRVCDFHPSDIVNPKGKRTLYLLSGIVNFLQFSDTRKEVYTEYCLSYRSTLDNIRQLQKALQEAEAKKEKLVTVPPEQQAEFKALSSEIHDLQQIISQEYRAKDVIFQEKIAQQKTEFAEKNKRLNEQKLAIATMKEEQERMRSQIVESPEQRKSKTERMKQTVHKLKQARQETSEKCDYYRDRVSLVGLWQSDVQGYLKKVQGIDSNLEMHRKICEEIRQNEEKIVNANLELKSLSNEDAQLKRTILLKKEKLAKLDIKSKKKQEDFNTQKQEILEICSRIQEKRQAVHGRVAQVLQEIQQTNCKKEQLLEKVEVEKMKCQEVITDFRAALEKYHDSLQKASERSADRRREKIAEMNRRLNRQ